MKTRIIHTKIWEDEWFGNLDTESKLIFIYLISNQFVGMTGAYEISFKRIAFDTGLNISNIEKIITNNLKEKINYVHSNIIITNATQYNNYASNDKQSKAYMKEYHSLPEEVQNYLPTFQCSEYSPKYKKNNGQYQHRLVAEKYLGRKLLENEVVHHIDKNPSNNDPLNLCILSLTDHIAIHNKRKTLNDTSIILVSDLVDSSINHKSKIINNKSETINKEKSYKLVGNTMVETDE